jgi:hypothetical protein
VLARATAFQFAWLRRSTQRRRMRFDLAIREHEIGQQPLANREALAPFEERPFILDRRSAASARIPGPRCPIDGLANTLAGALRAPRPKNPSDSIGHE